VTAEPTPSHVIEDPGFYHRLPAPRAPFVRAPEATRTIFLATIYAACVPLLMGTCFFGWRAAYVAALSVGSCVVIEWMYYRITRTPALLGRTHAVLTGLLLALTLPPFAPWYAVIIGAVFAIVVGKGIFGGVGHFVWHPALIGRVAIAVMLPLLARGPADAHPNAWPILSQHKVFIGDLSRYRYVDEFREWRGRAAPIRVDAFLVTRPETTLAALTRGKAQFTAIARSQVGAPHPQKVALMDMPSLPNALTGAIPGAIGETSAVLIVIAGLYLVYRNFVRWQLPAAIVLSAAITAAVAPVQLMGLRPYSAWWPVVLEGLDAGIIYVAYQVGTGGLMLTAFFLATEMTTRPATRDGQIIFGAGIGILAMLLRLYTSVPVPCFVAVLIMNSFTQTIDRVWRPRVLGRPRWPLLERLRWR